MAGSDEPSANTLAPAPRRAPDRHARAQRLLLFADLGRELGMEVTR
jgi:hypothetical protein